ncbi:TetR/AcrR family transcriptional regulator [Paenibacillus harenae]|uniref:AcrR family transcriptional regulator n=1 Tax=Paenibacillus harenae TaxID=306543 RepID=A0ABT9U7F4_PAEHA|nr:TetR/AcrR family transcriptional regulator [Paenibacillus harenae]MDQ0115152.1 AcrR family transcriptional regulator [Paenibacillus harenae]
MKTTRETIVRVSFQLFLRKSFKEVTIKEIVENAGVSQGAFFHYFKTKDELFLEIVENSLQTMLDMHFTKFDNSSLYKYYHDYIEWLTGEGRDFDLNYFSLFFDALKLFPHFREKLAKIQQAELDAWMKVIHGAKSIGEIQTTMSAEQIAKMFVSTSDGIGIRSILVGTDGPSMKRTLMELWDGIYLELKA